MTAIEIVLLIVGMFFILGSFWVTEKLSPSELEHIAELSKEEMGAMLETELEKSKQRVVDLVGETIDSSKEQTERSLEKQTNEKIMAINEFSDTVIEKMNKTHNEIMFLYSMLNDKHTELTDFSSTITQQIQDLKSQEEELTNYYLSQLKQQKPQYTQPPVQTATYVQVPEAQTAADVGQNSAEVDPEPEAAVPAPEPAPDAVPQEESEEEVNVRDEIFRLYDDGKDSVAIAKKLGMGVGEVRLILGLYKGDHSSEV